MSFNTRARSGVLATLMLGVLGACSSTGGLGGILGGVLGGGSSQVSGLVQNVDTRSRQIGIRQTNGQTVLVAYDDNTQVLYQNQTYTPSSLERGDDVTASIQDNGNGGYYTNRVQVNQSVRGGSTGQSNTVQSFQGTVRQVDRSNGWFTIDDANVGRITVFLPNQLSRADTDRYNNLRTGDVVRLYGYRTSASQVQLQQFY